MKKFNKISIIGTGLIGGSLGLAIKQKGMAKEVFGIAKHQETIKEAIEIGAIDKGSLRLKDVEKSELIIVCTPVGEIVSTIQKIIPFLDQSCLITDVGSTKEEIVKEVNKFLPPHIHFVGGHPLAGSEKRGIKAAQANLFEGSLAFLTKSKQTNQDALNKIKQFWKEIGTRTKVISTDKHDKIVAAISHLPHIVAVSLTNSVQSEHLKYAAKSWKDLTRIASSDALLWKDICLSNKKGIVESLERLIEHLVIMKDLVAKEDLQKLANQFRRARQKKLRYEKIVIAIDGPAGAGKSVVGKRLADKLDFVYLDTGAMYRAITLKAIRKGINLNDKNLLIKMCRQTKIDFIFKKRGQVVLLLDGEDVHKEIRKGEVTKKVFYLAKLPEIRERMVDLQRKLSRGKNIVAEGRDMGSVVFPQAKKFYLDASLKERTERRYKQLLVQEEKASLEEIKKDIRVRDKKDSKRKTAPLKRVEDAFYIDTTKMGIEEVVKRILARL